MKEKNFRVKYLVFLVLPLVVLFIAANVSNAQDTSRSQKGEVYGTWQYLGGDTTTGLGAKIELDAANVFGLGVGYNINEHFNLNTDLFFGSTDMDFSYLWVDLQSDTRIIGWDVNLDFNLLEGRFTPLATGGIGFMNFDGDWGSSASSFSETDFSYNLGAGIRWDITDKVFLKAMYKFTWTELEDTDDKILLDGPSISIGLTF